MKIIDAHIKFSEKLFYFFKDVSKESVFLSFDEHETLSLDECKNMIFSLNKKGNIFLLGINSKDNIIGSVTLRVTHNRKRLSHVATLGIVVKKEFWGHGYGKILMDEMLYRAKTNEIEKIILNVTSSNSKAIRLYERLGFVIEGRITKAIKINNVYYDSLTMCKFL